MSRYIVRRLLSMIPVLFVVTALVFALVQMIPGDPAITYLGGQNFDPTKLAAAHHKLGLDQPLPVQYVKWVYHGVQGDFGTSIVSGQSTLTELRHRIPVSFQIVSFSLLLSLAIAFPAGIIAAVMRNRPADTIISVVAMAGVAVPSFWLALLLITLFSVELRWLPPSGHASILRDPLGAVKLMILPGFALGSAIAAGTLRQIRSSMLEVLNQDYVRTARAKGLKERVVLLRHVQRNALLPVVTVVGLQIPRLLGGAVIIESIFGIPGTGQLAVQSIFERDFLVVQGFVLLTALVTLMTNLATDICYAYVDPRIRYS